MQVAGLALLIGAVLGASATAAATPPLATPEPLVAIAPVPGPVLRAFSAPEHPYGPGHRGVDLVAVPGQTVVAALAGTVAFAGSVAGVRWVTLHHANGLETTYGGVNATVGVGARVALGQGIGRIQDGRRHLDWGVRLANGYLDPLGLLTGWRAMLVPVTDR